MVNGFHKILDWLPKIISLGSCVHPNLGSAWPLIHHLWVQKDPRLSHHVWEHNQLNEKKGKEAVWCEAREEGGEVEGTHIQKI